MTVDAQDWIGELAGLVRSTSVTSREGTALTLDGGLGAAQEILQGARHRGRKAMVVGNGGSAAIAAHVQTDLAHSIGLRTLVLHEPSLLTAQSNDHGYEHAFANLAALWTDPGDVMIAISSSGRSPNLLAAGDQALARGARLLTFTGFAPDNPLRAMGHFNFHVASRAYGLVESAHTVLLHRLTDCLLQAVATGA